jgi:hypothetical protein
MAPQLFDQVMESHAADLPCRRPGAVRSRHDDPMLRQFGSADPNCDRRELA